MTPRIGLILMIGVLSAYLSVDAAQPSKPAKNAIIFTRVTDGYWQLWTMDPDGNNAVQRTFSESDKRNPVWINQKPEVLFHTSDNRLFKLNLETGQEVQLMPELGQLGEACFTPDAKSFIYTLIDENVKDASNLWMQDLTTGKRTLLTQDPGLQYSPRVSPDGRRVVYVAGKGWGNHEIWIMDLVTREKQKLTDNEVYDIKPEFSKDGSRVLYASNAMGTYDIWVMDRTGEHNTRLTKLLGSESSPSWSPDDSRIVLSSQRGGDEQIWTMDANGGDWRQLTEGPGEAKEPSWRK